MITENLQKFAYVMMFVNIAFLLMNTAGFFPVAYTVGGYDAIEDLTSTITDITTQFEGAGNSLEYLLVAGFMLIMGVKIIILFLILVFFGLGAIMAVLGIPAVIYAPIIVVVDCIILYDFAKMLLKIG